MGKCIRNLTEANLTQYKMELSTNNRTEDNGILQSTLKEFLFALQLIFSFGRDLSFLPEKFFHQLAAFNFEYS